MLMLIGTQILTTFVVGPYRVQYSINVAHKSSCHHSDAADTGSTARFVSSILFLSAAAKGVFFRPTIPVIM